MLNVNLGYDDDGRFIRRTNRTTFSGSLFRFRTETEKKGSVRKSEAKDCSVEKATVTIFAWVQWQFLHVLLLKADIRKVSLGVFNIGSYSRI